MCSTNMYVEQIYICLLIVSLIVLSECFSCSRKTNDFRCRLTTMTPYRFIVNNTDDSELIIPGCEAKKIWLVIRHGARYPGKKIISMMHQLSNVQRIVANNCRTHRCPLDPIKLKHLAEWESTVTRNKKMHLHPEGEDELIAIGERFQSRFPHLMPEKYTNVTYKFKFTATERAEKSAEHFAIGLFGKHQSNNVWYPEAEKKDPILRFYKACTKWEHNVDKNPDAYAEVTKFKQSPTVTNMLKDISNRFSHNFTFDTVELIYKTCAFETAWNRTAMSPWCDFLTNGEFEIMEFIQDLQYYWIDGYGYELTYKQACMAIKDMFYFMETDDAVKTSAYFTHSGAILKILSYLGIAKDDKPLFHNSHDTSKDRLWRTSMIDTFASNIAFVLYNCASTGPSILVMHQERIVQLPGCPSGIPCPITTLKENYPVEDKCNLNHLCSVDEQP